MGVGCLMCEQKQKYGNVMCTLCKHKSTYCGEYDDVVKIYNNDPSDGIHGYFKSWECNESGHIFVWTSINSDNKCPPEQKCLCGKYNWKEWEEITKPSIWDGEER
jgi:hypothetical protein